MGVVTLIAHHAFSQRTSTPNVKLTPRSFSPQPSVSLSGSDHSRSHSRPWSGTSHGRMMRRICSIDVRSGLRPPWQQKIFSSTVRGSVMMARVNISYAVRVCVECTRCIHTDCGDRQAVEAVGESLPQLDGVATLALVVESTVGGTSKH